MAWRAWFCLERSVALWKLQKRCETSWSTSTVWPAPATFWCYVHPRGCPWAAFCPGPDAHRALTVPGHHTCLWACHPPLRTQQSLRPSNPGPLFQIRWPKPRGRESSTWGPRYSTNQVLSLTCLCSSEHPQICPVLRSTWETLRSMDPWSASQNLEC